MPPNWDEIYRCNIWPLLGVTECNGCDGLVQCWGEETQMVEEVEHDRENPTR